jgi:hypothetical protein
MRHCALAFGGAYDKNTLEAFAEPEGAWTHGIEPHAPSVVPRRHVNDAVWTMSPADALPVHFHPPCG